VVRIREQPGMASRRTLQRASRCHPWLLADANHHQNRSYLALGELESDEFWRLEPPLDGVTGIDFEELTDVRRRVQAWALLAGLPTERIDDIVLAVNEVATNSIRHGGGKGRLDAWTTPEGSFVCELRDAGRMADPLVGLRGPGPNSAPTGLWLVNQLCDLVEIRSDSSGTQVRLTVCD